MTCFCTYCSAEKSREPGDLPAIDRYSSGRIRDVFRAARILHLPFCILSGRYGLIPHDFPIPWYDHLLTGGDVQPIAARVVDQLRGQAVTHLIYFTRPLTSDIALAPYRDALATAADIAGIPLCVVELPGGAKV